MTNAPRKAFPARIPLLEFLLERGWKPVRDNGSDEVAGLCPLHRDTRPSFYVNRRKQVFYCHGCGCGGGLSRLTRLLGDSADPLAFPLAGFPSEQLLEDTYGFYQRSLVRSESALAYLAARGIQDRALIERMRIGYAPGACLRGHLERRGYSRQELTACGLTDGQGRDRFFRCLTFPLPDAGNLYGRPINGCLYRHRFLPGSKGGLYGWVQAAAFAHVIVVEGLFDVAALWQAGFHNAVAALGSHLNNRQLNQLCQSLDRLIYICFDADRNGSGQRAAHGLSMQLRQAGMEARRVALPRGHDPASFLAAGATACDFGRCLERARP
jgi:DNA primase